MLLNRSLTPLPGNVLGKSGIGSFPEGYLSPRTTSRIFPSRSGWSWRA